jgi:hypothetical protein
LIQFFCGSLGWLEECSFQWSAPPLIQDGCYGRHLGFRFRRTNTWVLLIRFFCGLLGVTCGRFRSLISSAAHPNGRYGSHLGFRFRRLEDKCLRWLIQFFCGLLGVTSGGSFRWSAPPLIQDGHD